MITVFNRKELAITLSMQEQAEIRNKLSRNNIAYYVKTMNRTGPLNRHSITKAYPESSDENAISSCAYIIYVHKNDYDEARYVVANR